MCLINSNRDEAFDQLDVLESLGLVRAEGARPPVIARPAPNEGIGRNDLRIRRGTVESPERALMGIGAAGARTLQIVRDRNAG